MKKILPLFFIFVIFLSLVAGMIMMNKKPQDVRTHAEENSATGVTLSLVPSNQTVLSGQEFTEEITINTNDQTITAAELHLSYDTTKLQAIEVKAGTFLPVVLSQGTIDNGSINITLGCEPTTPQKGTGILATVKFKQLIDTSTEVTFTDTTQVAAIGRTDNVVNSRIGLKITLSTGNVNLKMKLKFQGINKLPATGQNSMVVKIKVNKEGETATIEGNGTFVSDDQGIWSGTVPVNIESTAGKYSFLVKGSHHIQKKICESVPTETKMGIYHCATGNISLNAGDNNLDFSGISLLVGDLDQNGIVDAVDFGLVKNNLGKTDPSILNISDLNRDGIINTQDYAMILIALGIRVDE